MFAANDGRSATPGSDVELVTIKKYANRRLYNTATSSYVTLDTLSSMVKRGEDFVVYDAKTSEDITRSVLTQIIFEEEAKGENLLPINFLRQLIRFYGDSMQAFVPGYLEISMDSLSNQQDAMRERLGRAFTGEKAIEAMREMTRQNMELFGNAMRMFSPFRGPNDRGDDMDAKVAPEDRGELEALRAEMRKMQETLEKLSTKE